MYKKILLSLLIISLIQIATNCPQCPLIQVFERTSLDTKMREVQLQYFTTDYVNFTLSDSIIELQFRCTSNFPTKWRLHPSPQRFSTLKDWSIVKDRMVGDMNDKSTYRYLSTVDLKFTNMPYIKFNQSASCYSIKDKDLNRNILLAPSEKGVLEGRIISRHNLLRANSGASSRYGKNKACSMIMRIDLNSYKATCDNTNNFIAKKPYIVQCSNPDECEAEVQSEKPDKDACRDNRTESLVRSCNNVDKCEGFNLKQPGAMICWIDNDIGNSLAKVIYMTIEHPPKLYINRIEDNISVKQLLKVVPVNKTSEVRNLHTFQTLTFTCIVSMSVFTTGSQWAFEYRSGDIFYLGRGHEEIMDNEARVYESRISLRCNSTDITKVICYSPLWNSDEWEEDFFRINVTDSEPPQIIQLSISNKTSLQGRAINGKFSLTLICEAIGKPIPKFKWLKNGTEFLVKQIYNQSLSIARSIIQIDPLPSNIKEQIFTCVAENMLGSVNQTQIVHNNDFLESSSSNQLPYLIGVPVALSIIILLFCFYHIWKVRRNEKLIQKLTEDEIQEFRNGDPFSQSQALFYPYNTEYEISNKQVHFESKVLGDGFFGLVTKGKIGKAPIAIKTVKKSADIAYLKALLDELKIMCYVGKHEHILSLIGASTENIRKREVYIFLEYCANGNLLKYLQSSRETFVDHLYKGKYNCSERLSIVDYENISVKKLSSKDLVKWAFEIASGMEYLTRKNIIHGDLAARNVLLTDTLQAKIGDFGLSKQLYNYSIYVQKLECPLPLKWMAIESLRDLEFSIKSDIWSYGVTLYEIFSLGQAPYPGLQWDTCSWKLLLDGYRMEIPSFASESIYIMMLKCWEENPDDRPPFTYLMNYFEEEMFRL